MHGRQRISFRVATFADGIVLRVLTRVEAPDGRLSYHIHLHLSSVSLQHVRRSFANSIVRHFVGFSLVFWLFHAQREGAWRQRHRTTFQRIVIVSFKCGIDWGGDVEQILMLRLQQRAKLFDAVQRLVQLVDLIAGNVFAQDGQVLKELDAGDGHDVVAVLQFHLEHFGVVQHVTVDDSVVIRVSFLHLLDGDLRSLLSDLFRRFPLQRARLRLINSRIGDGHSGESGRREYFRMRDGFGRRLAHLVALLDAVHDVNKGIRRTLVNIRRLHVQGMSDDEHHVGVLWVAHQQRQAARVIARKN